MRLRLNNTNTITITPTAKDINICIGNKISFKYSDFTIISHSRPWDIIPTLFDSCKAEQIDSDNIIVTSQTSDFCITDKWSVKDDLLWIDRKWKYLGTEPLLDAAIGSLIPSGEGSREKITIPHVLYNNNPSADPQRLVAHLPKEKNYHLVVEESRLPIPAVNVEWEDNGQFLALSVFTIPSLITPAEGEEQYWTLGGRHTGNRLDILSLSGVVALNNQKDFIYSNKNVSSEYPGGGYLKLESGDIVEKTIIIDFYECEGEGRGFRKMVREASNIYKPKANALLTFDEIINLKINALSARWYDGGRFPGFLSVPLTLEEGNIYNRKKGFLYGWTGQSNRAAWCSIAYGLKTGDESWLEKGKMILDNFAAADIIADAPGLRCNYYDVDADKWWANSSSDMEKSSSRAFGEAISNMAECIILLRENNQSVKDIWIKTVEEGVSFLRTEQCLTDTFIYPIYWNANGAPINNTPTAAGIPCVMAMFDLYRINGESELLDFALEMLNRYYEQFAKTFERPFSRSTLDAGCEDKEAGIYFFLAAYKAWNITGNKLYAEYARLSAEWICTFLFFWKVKLRPETECAKNGFETTYWPGVSVQNHHLDVFFPSYEVYKLGKELGDNMLKDIGMGAAQAFSHGIAQYPGHWSYPTPGEQGEQFYQTNFMYKDPSYWRCGFGKWNTLWILALVLQETIRFKDEEE